LTTTTIEFRTFADDGQWKVNRDNELVGVFATQESAEAAALGFAEEVSGNGGTAKVLLGQDGGTTLERSFDPSIQS
jgi:hypothetical protein